VTPSNQRSLAFGGLESATQIVALDHATYVLDAGGDLHRFDGEVSTVVGHGIHGIVGDRDLLLICRRNGELGAVARSSPVRMTTERRRRCASRTAYPV
jgi:hypothetical protein